MIQLIGEHQGLLSLSCRCLPSLDSVIELLLTGNIQVEIL